MNEKELQDLQDRKRQDRQDFDHLAYPAACDLANPVILIVDKIRI
jgi:hypothetical protein